MVVGAGLVLCGGLIVFGIGRHFEEVAEADVAEHTRAEEPRAAAGLARLARAAAAGCCCCFYALASEALGFLPTAAIMVLVASTRLRCQAEARAAAGADRAVLRST